MKLSLVAIGAFALIISNFGCTSTTTRTAAPGTPSAPAVVTIDYVDPGRFTDFRINNRDFQHSSTVFTQNVTSALLPVMARRFPAHTLDLRFTNIDLAGRRTTGPQSVRVVRTRTPARLAFDYVLRDPSGRIVASGSQRLVDTGSRASRGPNTGPVGTETNMMRRWLQSLRTP